MLIYLRLQTRSTSQHGCFSTVKAKKNWPFVYLARDFCQNRSLSEKESKSCLETAMARPTLCRQINRSQIRSGDMFCIWEERMQARMCLSLSMLLSDFAPFAPTRTYS